MGHYFKSDFWLVENLWSLFVVIRNLDVAFREMLKNIGNMAVDDDLSLLFFSIIIVPLTGSSDLINLPASFFVSNFFSRTYAQETRHVILRKTTICVSGGRGEKGETANCCNPVF